VDMADVEVAIARTQPPGPGQPPVREVEELYLDMIARARQSIYIENQYFTAYRLGEALAARLAEPGGPEIVLVSRLLSHGWLEEHTMHVLRARLVRRLQEADREGRFHIYYPHAEGLKEGTCIDVHSKLMIVDDVFTTLGSANINVRSMYTDSEMNIAHESEAVSSKLRRELWSLHTRNTETGKIMGAQDDPGTAYTTWANIIRTNKDRQSTGQPPLASLIEFYRGSPKRTYKD